MSPSDDCDDELLSFFIRTLNGEKKARVREHVSFFLAHDMTIGSLEASGKFANHSNEELLGYAAKALTNSMHSMTDMWIDSGKNPTDPSIETPGDRNVEDIQPGRPFSLFHQINAALLNTHAQYIGMRRDGSTEVRKTAPRFDDCVFENFGGKTAFESYGQKLAAYHVCELLQSTQRSHRIAKCAHCASYFAHGKACFRTIKHGVFCKQCESRSSVQRTKRSRAKRIDTAARAWIEWELVARTDEQVRWVADQVNHAHGTAFGRRWISQNRAEISVRVEEFKNGKT